MAQEGRDKGESPDAGTEKGESPDAGTEKGESPDAGTEKGESPVARTEKAESSDASQEKGESSDAHQTEYLPTDLTYEILSRSEVEPLLAFKTVCKMWKQFVENPHFMRQHFELKSGESLSYFGECKTGCVDIDADITQKDILLCGCNGMVVKKNLETLGLLIENPSTHQERVLPPPPNQPRIHQAVFLVFIQSRRTYKLFSSSTGSDGKPLFHVLTLGEDHDWRPQQLFINEYEEINGYTSTGAFIHMIKMVGEAAQGRTAELITLDMEHERFTTTAMEQSLFSNWELVDLLSWNGSPALVDKAAQKLNVLTIDDYSRTHIIAGKKIEVELNVPNEFRDAEPLIAHQNLLWMHNGGRLLSYDILGKRVNEIPEARQGYIHDGTIYIGAASFETVPEMQSQHRS